MAKSSEPPVSESILGTPGPAMKQAMREFSGLPLDAPASLGESLPNAYVLHRQQEAAAQQHSYRLGGSRYDDRGSDYYARSAAEDFYTEEFYGDVDLGYQG